MSSSAFAAGIRHLRRKLAGQQPSDDSDERLLHAFTSQHDDDAFAVLVRRHGPMVLHVCRRVLGHEQDAEDAFQATFLVLARNCAALRNKASLASFLHGTAYRTAMKAKQSAARRRTHESQAPQRSPANPADELLWCEVRTLLDEEIARLPEKYRSVFVLCCLENLSRAEAGQSLGLKERTVLSRLSEARKRLSRRLSRRGVELTAVLAATALTTETATALPPLLISRTINAAALGDGTIGTVSASVAELMEAGGAELPSVKAKAAIVLLLGVTLLGGAGVWLSAEPPASPRPQVSSPAPRGGQKSTDSLVVRGRVLDPDGQPVVGAKLYLPRWPQERRQNQDDAAPVQRGMTDKSGRFRLELPRQQVQPDRDIPLLAVAENFGLTWVELPQKDAPGELTLRLVKDVPIRGRLLTTEGKPAVGVTVNVRGVMAFERLDDFLRAFQRERKHIDEGMSVRRLELPLNDLLHVQPTDKDGRFEIRGVGAERVTGLEVKSAAISEQEMLVVTREGFDAKTYLKGLLISKGERPLPLFGPSLEHVVERAEASRIFEGTVRESGNSKPVAGAAVEADDVSTRTDANGQYRLVGKRKAPEYWLQVSAPQNVPLIGRGQRVKVSAKEGGTPMRVDVELLRGIVVTGRVYDKATGKGLLSRVHFVPLPENKRPKTEELILSTVTGADGRYRLVTIPGPGVLLATVSSRNMKIEGVPIFPYKPAEFDAADRPRIRMTDQMGPHRYFLTADGVETLYHKHACKVLAIKEGSDAVTCDLVPDPGKTLTMNLRDPEDKPLAGARVMGVSTQTKQMVPLKSAACKIYALDPKNPRPVAFLHAERKLAALVTLRGDEKEPVTIRLASASVLTGRLVDADGQPIAEAEILTYYAQSDGGYVAAFLLQDVLPRTDKEGHFRLEGIVPGIKVNLGFLKGKQRLPLPPLNIKSLQSGQTFDVGDVRVKPGG